uniref:Uncharacterized protein n=1 Tax=Ciona savignyi TaxID=51511 RepID=H2ZHN2_CIOSA
MFASNVLPYLSGVLPRNKQQSIKQTVDRCGEWKANAELLEALP